MTTNTDDVNCSSVATHIHSLGWGALHAIGPQVFASGNRAHDQGLQKALSYQRCEEPLVFWEDVIGSLEWIFTPPGNQSAPLRDEKELCLVPLPQSAAWLGDLMHGSRMGRGGVAKPLKVLPVSPNVQAAHNSHLTFLLCTTPMTWAHVDHESSHYNSGGLNLQ